MLPSPSARLPGTGTVASPACGAARCRMVRAKCCFKGTVRKCRFSRLKGEGRKFMGNKTRTVALAAAAGMIAFSATTEANAVLLCRIIRGMEKCVSYPDMSMEECNRRVTTSSLACFPEALIANTGGAGSSKPAILQRENGQATLLIGGKAFPILVPTPSAAKSFMATLERNSTKADPAALEKAYDAATVGASRKVDDRLAKEVSEQFKAKIETGKRQPVQQSR